MVLVLDDYHLLSQESRLNGLINTLAFDNIPDFHLILISRGTPNIKLYTLASKQLCNRLDTADLAFTRDETASYLAARGLRMASGAIDKIMEKTDGWVSAIYLIGEGIRHAFGSRCEQMMQLLDSSFRFSRTSYRAFTSSSSVIG